jgi:hypothetical protein
MAELISHEYWGDLHRELLTCPWFEKVGESELKHNFKHYRYVGSWPETIPWVTCEYSWISIGIAQYKINSGLTQQQLNQWNNTVLVSKSQIDHLLQVNVKRSLRDKFRKITDTEESLILKWINICLVIAFSELAYSNILFDNYLGPLMDVYLQGHFPCGWTASEDGDNSDFPNNAQIVVF